MLSKKDYFLVFFIGFCLGLFLIPVLSNLKLGIDLNFYFDVGLVFTFSFLSVLALWISSLIALKIPVFLQIAKFVAVGGFNTLLDGGILNLLIYFTLIASGWTFIVFKGISFTIANLASYFWNHYWTFEIGEKINVKEFWKFFAVSIVGLIINLAAAFFVVNDISALKGFSPKRWANVGFLFATLASLVWNFIGYKFFVFIPDKENK